METLGRLAIKFTGATEDLVLPLEYEEALQDLIPTLVRRLIQQAPDSIRDLVLRGFVIEYTGIERRDNVTT